ncbi:enoyl-CoA hydratase/isomerase family protein [Alteribacter aurantiacus]|uniref:enoyl-CoA hydratase/isomerase family protein n=1 Tax=Alteribacter aurantiacus TaxID=254410 RepID=UPI00040EB1FF|nr:enoyl-CoA hydratase/isomerase family protein [Alteribacter aurantiacus]
MGNIIFTYEDRGFAKITLNRPEVKNAVDLDVVNQLNDILDQLEKKEDIKYVVFTGAGDAFCSGGDLNKFHTLRTKKEALGMLVPVSRILKRIRSLPMLTIAFINGHAVGGGCELAAACDFRVTVPQAKTGFVQGRLQITTGWGGATLLREKVPYMSALTMLTTARLFSAKESLALGWIQHIVKNEDEFLEWCKQWDAISPGVLRAYKQALSPKEKNDSIVIQIENEVDACAELWAKDEHHEAVERFLSNK